MLVTNPDWTIDRLWDREVRSVGEKSVKIYPNKQEYLDNDPRLKARKTKDWCYRIHWATACCKPDKVKDHLEHMLSMKWYIVIYPDKAGIPYTLIPAT